MNMKKIRLTGIALLALLAGSVVASCGGNNKEKEEEETGAVTNDLRFESYIYDMAGEYEEADTTLAPDARYIRFTSQGVLPEVIGDSDTNHLRDSLMKLARLSLDEVGKPQPILPDSMRFIDRVPDSISSPGYVSSSLTATLITPRVVVWKAVIESYPWHAAHGNRSAGYVNYSLEDNRILSLGDIMVPGYEARLTKLVRNALREKGVQLLGNLKNVPLSQEFAMTSTGLVFSYDPYEIAPYSEGIVEVELSQESVMPLLNDTGRYLLTGVKSHPKKRS